MYIYFIMFSQQLLQEQAPGTTSATYSYNHSVSGLPHLVGEFAAIVPTIRAIGAKIDRRNMKADNDNKLIFFQDTPSDVDRPPLPVGVSIMARKTYDVTSLESAPIVLFFKIT